MPTHSRYPKKIFAPLISHWAWILVVFCLVGTAAWGLFFFFNPSVESEAKSRANTFETQFEGPLWLPWITGHIKSDGTEESTMGFTDLQGKIQLSTQWDEVLLFEGEEARARWGETWGIIDRNGKWLVLPRYQEIGPSIEGFRAFQFGDSAGWLNAQNQQLGAANFDQVTSFQSGKAGAKLGGRWGFVNTWGQWQSPKTPLGGLLPLGKTATISLWGFKGYQDSLWGWMDAREKIHLLPSLDSIASLKMHKSQEIHIKAKKNGLWGVMNLQGKWLLPPKYQNILSVDAQTWGVQEGDFWHFISNDSTKKTLKAKLYWNLGPCQIPGTPHQINHLAEVLCVGQVQEGTGLVNSQDNWILEPKYAAIDSIGQGWWRTWQSGQEPHNTWDWLWSMWHPIELHSASILKGSLRGSPPLEVIDTITQDTSIHLEAPELLESQSIKSQSTQEVTSKTKVQHKKSNKPWQRLNPAPAYNRIQDPLPSTEPEPDSESGFYAD